MRETSTVTVYPTKESSLCLSHDSHGKMTPDGVVWPNDSFTKRRLADGSVTLEKPKIEAKVEDPKIWPSTPSISGSIHMPPKPAPATLS